VPHPVVLIGRIIERLDQSLNDPAAGELTRKNFGLLTVIMVVSGCAFLGWLIGWVIRELPVDGNWIIEAVVVSSLLAFRDLYNYVLRVAVGLEESLESGRTAVKHIVGRDPDGLNEAGVARATIESAAENFSDGVVAPVFFYVLFGLPGIFAYKAINTLDSMIGYKSDKYRAFGWAAARLDDVANWPAARLSGLAFIAASFFIHDACAGKAFQAMMRDACNHRSPNAGWPEAALAGALGLALAGPRVYGGHHVDDAWMGNGRKDASAADIRRALRLYLSAGGIVAAIGIAVIAI
jgi:adenosylcobinamide-phosphate synthase